MIHIKGSVLLIRWGISKSTRKLASRPLVLHPKQMQARAKRLCHQKVCVLLITRGQRRDQWFSQCTPRMSTPIFRSSSIQRLRNPGWRNRKQRKPKRGQIKYPLKQIVNMASFILRTLINQARIFQVLQYWLQQRKRAKCLGRLLERNRVRWKWVIYQSLVQRSKFHNSITMPKQSNLIVNLSSSQNTLRRLKLTSNRIIRMEFGS